MSIACKFMFPDNVTKEALETQLALAILAAECKYGQARVRIGTSYGISADASQIAIDVSTEVGEHVAEVFTGLMIRQIGEEQFSVDRIESRSTDKLVHSHEAS